MPSKDCVKEVKIKSFAFYMGACAISVFFVATLLILT
jgi:hypothetical protein